MKEDAVIQSTKNWLEKVIIHFNFCPFAKKEFVGESIHYEHVDERAVDEQLAALVYEFERLDNNPNIETTLVILAIGQESFFDYLDLLELANRLLVQMNYEGVYQLASFHPDYCFDGVRQTDPSNYTNRSPYPVIHIIREDSLQRALEKYPDPENIPDRNVERATETGTQVFQKLLLECKAK
jgi:hypothetical protein